MAIHAKVHTGISPFGMGDMAILIIKVLNKEIYDHFEVSTNTCLYKVPNIHKSHKYFIEKLPFQVNMSLL